MAKTTLYTLAFDAAEGPVVFYVGHTNNIQRRRAEHVNNAFNKNHPEYDTYKYRWCRELDALDIPYVLTPAHEIEDDEDSEYAWILKIARFNLEQGINFIDGYPLTNMKAGDFLTELIAIPEITTAEDIREYRNAKAVREIMYARDGGGTGEHTLQGAVHINEAHQIAEQLAAKERYAKSKKITRTTNPMNEESVRKANSLLLKRELEEGSMLWEEYNAEMTRIGYPAWTETRPQLLNKFN
jgi:hypothetical protein